MSTSLILTIMINISDRLTDWAQDSINALMQATAAEFDQAFDNFIANDAHITLNGKRISRDAYKKAIEDETSGETSASVNFLGSVENPTNNADAEGGTVGIFYSAIIHFHPPLGGLPQAVTENSSMNLIVKDQPVMDPPPGRVPIPVDLRRAFTVNHIQAVQSTLL